MRYLSVCSGIEAASVAWEPLGWEPVAFAEIEPFPSAVLAHHYPHVPNWGDITRFREWPDADVDVLVGGTPCQSFSVAGLRQGLRDPRGNLALVYLAIADQYRPEWVVWENVPGVLSSGGGRDFGAFLGALAELGYGFAYRVLDAQYVRVESHPRAVPQRRRRVFVVGHLGDWRRAAAVLLERESLSGHPAPRRTAGERVTGSLRTRSPGSGGQGTDFEQIVANTIPAHAGLCAPDFTNYVQWPTSIAPTLDAHYGEKWGQDNQHVDHGCGLFVPQFASSGQSGAAFAENHALTLNATNEVPYIAPAATDGLRRLTPTECERLQGFPDDYTLVPYRKKPAADGPRYKALGNSIAINCLRWIGERITDVVALA